MYIYKFHKMKGRRGNSSSTKTENLAQIKNQIKRDEQLTVDTE